MAVYRPLISYLCRQKSPTAILSFSKIEEILERPLPVSAKKYPAFWSKGNHLGKELRASGWKASLQLRFHQIAFRRTNIEAEPVRRFPETLSPSETGKKSPDIVLIGCVKSKRDGHHRVEDLYTSPLFIGRAEYARSTGKQWFVLSSEYGLLEPGDIVATYDVALKDLPTHDRRTWSRRVLAQIDQKIGSIRGKVIELHAGKAYRDYGVVQGLVERGAEVSVPLAHLRQGEQLSWYSGYRPATRRASRDAGATPPRSAEPQLIAPPMPAERVREIVQQLTEEFSNGALDLSSRTDAPICGWEGIPEIKMAEELRPQGITDIELRIILTLGVAMDRARDADRLWDAVMRMFRSNRWAFDPDILKSVDMNTLRKAMADSGVSQRHGKDSDAWQRIGAAMVSPKSPPAFREVIFQGRATYTDLQVALQAHRPDSKPWFPLLRGPKISLVWLRMLVTPGRAEIHGLNEMPVAVDVQVRKATEYLGVTQTYGLPLLKVKSAIQRTWQSGAERARGPGLLAGTASALDPAIWFFAKWGCTYCERIKRKAPISSLCNGCQLDSLKFGGE